MKPAAFVGTALDDLREFPRAARREAGNQIDRVQRGLNPDDWKPMPGIGTGVREIRIRDDIGAFRVVYVAAFAEAVYVLHAFQQKTQQTAKRDIDVATARFRQLVRDRS
jgi:phage-related protein